MSDTPDPPVRRGFARLIEAARGLGTLWDVAVKADDAAQAAKQIGAGAASAPAPSHCKDEAPSGWHCTRPDVEHAQCTLERDRA